MPANERMNGVPIGTHDKPRVAVCIPCGDSWKAPMAFQSLCLGIQSAPHTQILPLIIIGDDTAQARNALVRAALAEDADYILWIDADMIFPPDALLRLLAHKRDIVGADYRRRVPPFGKIGLSIHPDDPKGLPMFKGEKGATQKTGLVERAIIGLGLMLVRADVYRALPAPWFVRIYTPEHATADNPDGFSTEDSYFCQVARMKDYRIWCDLDLTAQVLHVGEAVVPWQLPETVPNDLPDNSAVAVSP